MTELCKINFFIGNFFCCEVLCDVVEMDVFHLILGKLWQFYTGVCYDGHANTYTFDWKNKKLHLLSSPILKNGNSSDINNKATFISVIGNQFSAEFWAANHMLALLVVEQNLIQNKIP